MRGKLKENTWLTKESIIKSKILPYFARKRLCDLSVQDVISWQNELLAQGYSSSYLKTVHNQFSAMINHGVRYYNLRSNPVARAGNMGREEQREMLFWTKDEYLRFIHAIDDSEMAFHCFEMLYWCGLREGELLALTAEDFDFPMGTVRISKSYQRLKKRDVITSPKTPKSNRVVQMPLFLCEEMKEFIKDAAPEERVFPVSKYFLKEEMLRGCAASGVKRIRIHDLRHSHVSLLIDMGFTALAIAERMGHESSEMTYRYAHLFPTRQMEMADRLHVERTRRTPPASLSGNIISFHSFHPDQSPRGGSPA